MKNIWKQALLYSVVLGGTAFFAGCTPDEELNLPGYPESAPGIVIAQTKGSSLVELKAVYDSEGNVVLNGTVSRTYIVSLPTANLEDVTIKVEPILVNIPADKVTVSETELLIPAGFVSAEVVIEVPDNLDFIRPDYEAKTYEVGLKVTEIKGTNVILDGPAEAKVVVAKDAYVAGVSLVGKSGNEVSFTRSYWEGVIYDKDIMTYTMKARLDKPAKSDVKVRFESTGLADQFKKDMKITPSELTIRAGELESDEATWTLTDDFLLTTDDIEKHKIVVKAVAESTDTTVKTLEEQDILTFNITKALSAVEVIPALDSNWSMFNRAGWKAYAGGTITYGSASAILDGSIGSDIDGNPFWVSVDMNETKSMVGIVARYYSTNSRYAANKVKISISDDNKNWSMIGDLNIAAPSGIQYFKIRKTMNTRYVKFDMASASTVWLAELEVYGTK